MVIKIKINKQPYNLWPGKVNKKIYHIMRLFIKQLISFSVFVIIMTIVICSFYSYNYVHNNKLSINDLPAPNFSNSLSYNEKILFSRNKKADIISIGSSMSLYNLYSATIIDSLHSNSYLNLSSWGLKIEETYGLLKLYASYHKPRIVIISSNLADFRIPDKVIHYRYVNTFLKSNNFLFTYFAIKNFSFRYYAENLNKKKELQSSNNFYASLNFDKYGAVLFDSVNFKISKSRWNETFIVTGQPSSYKYLDSIAHYCKYNNIKLLFIQSPFREGLAKRLLNDTILINHIYKVKRTVTIYGQEFINANNQIWPDSLFVDATHLNAQGARKFTQYCFKNYPAIK